MMRISQQAVALLQSQFADLLVDGIDGPLTQKALGCPLTLEIVQDHIGMSLDEDGDPDWAQLLRIPGFDDDFGDPGVSGSFVPRGVLIHHTAGPVGREKINTNVLRNGRPDLRGPLVQIGISRNGAASFITNGRAQHAGKGCSRALTFPEQPRQPLVDDTWGNSHFIGIEIDNSGKDGDEYPPPQYDRAVSLAAKLCKAWGWKEHHVLGHKEWTRRKVDPSFDMFKFRDAVSDFFAKKTLAERLVATPNKGHLSLEQRVAQLEHLVLAQSKPC